jgi:hypothetical protein
MQVTLRAIFEKDPAKRRQQGRRDRDTHGLEILAERQLQHGVSRRNRRRAEEALVERL